MLEFVDNSKAEGEKKDDRSGSILSYQTMYREGRALPAGDFEEAKNFTKHDQEVFESREVADNDGTQTNLWGSEATQGNRADPAFDR